MWTRCHRPEFLLSSLPVAVPAFEAHILIRFRFLRSHLTTDCCVGVGGGIGGGAESCPTHSRLGDERHGAGDASSSLSNLCCSAKGTRSTRHVPCDMRRAHDATRFGLPRAGQVGLGVSKGSRECRILANRPWWGRRGGLVVCGMGLGARVRVSRAQGLGSGAGVG